MSLLVNVKLLTKKKKKEEHNFSTFSLHLFRVCIFQAPQQILNINHN